ncbi:MAG TPA: acyl-CoA dehydrogenase family protein, partial [Longimicrobiales bacterium]
MSTTAPAVGLDRETLEMTLDAIRQFAEERLGRDVLLDLDHRDECPEEIVRAMCTEMGIHLLFIPEDCEGMGAGTMDVYRVCETLAAIDLGVATAVFATFLGSDPILFGGTEEQRRKWMTRIATEALLLAYGATEPEAGSDLGALRTVARPVEEDGKVVGYKLSGAKQWISNGGIADVYTILARTPSGPSWFVVEKGIQGLSHGKPEDKHGIRASNTAALTLEDVYVDAAELMGNVEGQGLLQAQNVFGHTRLMVAAFGLGAGWAALDRAIPYSTTRIQGGSPLSEKQGYTHKLIVPHVARLEAARSFIEETAARLDAG